MVSEVLNVGLHCCNSCQRNWLMFCIHNAVVIAASCSSQVAVMTNWQCIHCVATVVAMMTMYSPCCNSCCSDEMYSLCCNTQQLLQWWRCIHRVATVVAVMRCIHCVATVVAMMTMYSLCCNSCCSDEMYSLCCNSCCNDDDVFTV